MPALAAIDCIPAEGGKPCELAVSLFDQGKTTAEHSFSAGTIEEAVAECDKFISEKLPGKKFHLLCDGPSTIRKHLAPVTSSMRKEWNQYIDIRREVERVHRAKCSNLLACMAAVGADPIIPAKGLETCRSLTLVAEKLSEQGHEFKRALTAKAARGDAKTSAEKPAKEERKKKKAAKRTRAGEEEEKEAKPAHDAPPPPPTPARLRSQLFEACETKPVDCPDLAAAIKDAFSVSSSSTRAVSCPPSSPAAVAATLGHAFLAAGLPAQGMVVVVVESVTAVLETIAALSEHLHARSLPIMGEGTPRIPATVRVLVTTPRRVEAVLENLPNTLSSLISVVATPAATEGLLKRGPVVALSVAEEAAPAAEEESALLADSESTTLSPEKICDEALTMFAVGNVRGAAERLKAMHSAHCELDHTVAAMFYYVLAQIGRKDDVQALQELHFPILTLIASLVTLESEPSGKANRENLLPTVVRSIRKLPAPPHPEAPVVGMLKSPLTGQAMPATAILSYAARHLPEASVDALSSLWGVALLVEPSQNFDAHAIKYGKVLGLLLAFIEATLLKRLENEHLGVEVGKLEEELRWGWYFKGVFGPFPRFITRCKGAFNIDRVGKIFKVSCVSDAARAIGETKLPVGGQKKEQTVSMSKAAIEEILTILPRGTTPTMLSSLGVSIGGWSRFNNRHLGLLGETLQAFLMRFPEHFGVQGRKVWRMDPSTSPSFDTKLLKHGGREADSDSDDAAQNQKKRRRGSRRERIHKVITEKNRKRVRRQNSLRSLKKQKVPGFGKKKIKHRGKGTTPHYAKR